MHLHVFTVSDKCFQKYQILYQIKYSKIAMLIWIRKIDYFSKIRNYDLWLSIIASVTNKI